MTSHATRDPRPPRSLERLMAHEFIYTCYKLARHYPPDRTVLENISLSFYPGAKTAGLGAMARQVELCSDPGRDWTTVLGPRPLTTGSASDTSPGTTPLLEKGRRGQVMTGSPRSTIIDRKTRCWRCGRTPMRLRKIGRSKGVAGQVAHRRVEPRPQRRDGGRAGCTKDTRRQDAVGGERRRARMPVLLSEPDICCFDEPTNPSKRSATAERFLQE